MKKKCFLILQIRGEILGRSNAPDGKVIIFRFTYKRHGHEHLIPA